MEFQTFQYILEHFIPIYLPLLIHVLYELQIIKLTLIKIIISKGTHCHMRLCQSHVAGSWCTKQISFFHFFVIYGKELHELYH